MKYSLRTHSFTHPNEPSIDCAKCRGAFSGRSSNGAHVLQQPAHFKCTKVLRDWKTTRFLSGFSASQRHTGDGSVDNQSRPRIIPS